MPAAAQGLSTYPSMKMLARTRRGCRHLGGHPPAPAVHHRSYPRPCCRPASPPLPCPSSAARCPEPRTVCPDRFRGCWPGRLIRVATQRRLPSQAARGAVRSAQNRQSAQAAVCGQAACGAAARATRIAALARQGQAGAGGGGAGCMRMGYASPGQSSKCACAAFVPASTRPCERWVRACARVLVLCAYTHLLSCPDLASKPDEQHRAVQTLSLMSGMELSFEPDERQRGTRAPWPCCLAPHLVFGLRPATPHTPWAFPVWELQNQSEGQPAGPPAPPCLMSHVAKACGACAS